VAKYVEGEHTYENINGKIYKNGRLIPEKDYKYIPTAIGGTRDGTPSTSPTLRDFIAGQGGTVGYDPSSNQVQVSLGGNTLSFGSGQGQQYGLGGLANNQNVVANPQALLAALGQGQGQGQGQQQQAMGMGMMPNQADILAMMQDYYENQLKAQRQQLMNIYGDKTMALERERAGVGQAASQQRTQAEINAQMDAKRLRAVLANMGWIGDSQSGQTRTDLGRVQGDLQQSLSTIGQHEMAQQGDISRRIADLEIAKQGDIAQMQSALQADQAAAMWAQLNQDRNFGYQVGRDQVADQRYDREWAWQTSPENPSYQAQVLQNQIRQLELQNLPEVHKLELQRLKQQIQAGQIDAATAQERLRQLKNPPQVEAPTEDLSKQVNTYYSSIEKLYDRSDATKYPFGEAGDRAWQADVGTYLTNLRSSGVSDDVIIEIMRRLGLPFKYDD
jgi:hypothetical protein